MARIEISSQGWGWLVDGLGNPLANTSATLKNLDGTNATTWSAITGGSSSTAALTSNSDGTLPRYVEDGPYTLTVGATTRRVEASGGQVEGQNVRRFGATGDGTTDDVVAVQAAVDALPAAGGEVFFPAGDFVIGTPGIVIPVGKHVVLRGSGRGSSVTASGYATRLLRKAAYTGTVISATGATSMTAGSACSFSLHDLFLHGNSTGGLILDVASASDVMIDRVRVGYSGASSGVRFRQLWNSDINNFRVHNCGSGTGSPAVDFGAVAATSGGCITVHCLNWEIESCAGTELRLNGVSGSTAPVGEVIFTNLKIEDNTNGGINAPHIDIGYSGHCGFVNVKLVRAANRTGLFIAHATTGATVNRPTKFVGLSMDSNAITASAPTYFIDHTSGALLIEGVTGMASNSASLPATAWVHVGSGVNAPSFAIDGICGFYETTGGTSVTRVLDDRASTIASAATIAIPKLHGRVVFLVTGTTPISSITATDWEGKTITLIFQTGAASMLVDGSNLKLAASLSPGADDAVALSCHGGNWYQVSALSAN